MHAPAKFPSLSLVVPAYNERGNLTRVVSELLRFGQGAVADFELIVVDDGSEDGSEALLGALAAPGLRILRHPHNRGLSAALHTGFYAAKKELVLWAPADGQIAATELAKLLQAWRGEDLLLSTYRARDDGLGRALLSRGLRLLLRLATGLGDRLEGVYLFRRALLERMTLVSSRSAGGIGFELALKARRLDLRIGSTEIECSPRLGGRSKVANLRTVGRSLLELWQIRRSL